MLLSSLAATVYKLSSLSTSAVFEVSLQQSLHVFITTRRMQTGDSTLMDLILSNAQSPSFDHEKS